MKIYWKNTEPPQELNNEQKAAFGWLIKLFKKKDVDLTDRERQIQEIYKNIIIFNE